MMRSKQPEPEIHSDPGRDDSGSGIPHESAADNTMVVRAELSRTLSRISTARSTPQYVVYKRRFLGLFQLVLLNMVVSWNWIAFAPVSGTASEYFNRSETAINWLSTVFLFAFVVTSPITYFALHRYGPKMSIVIAACLIFAGSWIKYGGTRANNFGVVMFGQLLLGFAQPFVLSAPTAFSNMWFSPAGRTTATALASLSNAFGAAIGQLISPFWATSASQIPNSILYISIISTVASVPAFFIPAKPPTPSSAATDAQNTTTPSFSQSTKKDIHTLFRSLGFYLLAMPFIIYVGFFNSFTSVLNQILFPWGFTEEDAGIAGAILIVAGLLTAAISSPLVDKYKCYVAYIKTAVPMIGLCYLVFVWAPETRSVTYVFIVCGVLGAACFGLVPVVLEFLVEIHYPISPEITSSICWAGGQLLGGIFIVVMDALKDDDGGITPGGIPGNMKNALIFQAVLALLVLPLPLCLGLGARKGMIRRRRWEAEVVGARPETHENYVDFVEGEEEERRVLS